MGVSIFHVLLNIFPLPKSLLVIELFYIFLSFFFFKLFEE